MKKGIVFLVCLLSSIGISQTDAQIESYRNYKKYYSEKISNSNLNPTLKQAYLAIYTQKLPKLIQTLQAKEGLEPMEKVLIADAVLKFMQLDEQKDLQNSFRNYTVNLYFDTFEKIVLDLENREQFKQVFSEVSFPMMERVVSNFNTRTPYMSHLEDIKLYYEIIGLKSALITNVKKFKSKQIFHSKLTDYVIYHVPDELLTAVQQNDAEIISILENSSNPYAKTILETAKKSDAKRWIPFIQKIHENPENITTISSEKNDLKYMQLLVDESIAAHNSDSKFTSFIDRVTKENLNYMVNSPINDNHYMADSKRFAILKKLRINDLYFAMVFGDDYLYTSSVIGIFNEWKSRMKNDEINAFFEKMEHVRIDDFVSLISDFGLLTEFTNVISTDVKKTILDKFIHPLKGSSQENKLKAMQMADAMYEIAKDEKNKHEVHSRIEKVIEESEQIGDLQNEFLYRNLDELLQDKDGKFSKNAVMSYQTFQDANGKIPMVMYFYGDADGKSSYANFIQMMTKNTWKIAQNNEWITCTHPKNPDLVLYANKPLDEKSLLDTKAQDNMVAFFQSENTSPKVLIHRGHSYYLYSTMMRQTGKEALAILGSCGGYENILDIYRKNKYTEVIATKQIGSKFVNDPMMEEILGTLVKKQDVNWEIIWDSLSKRLKSQKDLLSEYVPPHKNYGLILLRELDENN